MIFEGKVQTKSQALTSIRLHRLDIEEIASLDHGLLEEKVIKLRDGQTAKLARHNPSLKHSNATNVISIEGKVSDPR